MTFRAFRPEGRICLCGNPACPQGLSPARDYRTADAVAGFVLLIVAVSPFWVLAFGLPA